MILRPYISDRKQRVDIPPTLLIDFKSVVPKSHLDLYPTAERSSSPVCKAATRVLACRYVIHTNQLRGCQPRVLPFIPIIPLKDVIPSIFRSF
jgi:hypothetical protein